MPKLHIPGATQYGLTSIYELLCWVCWFRPTILAQENAEFEPTLIYIARFYFLKGNYLIELSRNQVKSVQQKMLLHNNSY